MTTNVMSRIIATGLVITIVFTALAFGTVEAWSVAGFCLLITALMLLWAIHAIQQKQFSVQLYPLMLPLALFVLYGAIQSIAFVREDGTTSSLSLDVEATRRALPVHYAALRSTSAAATRVSTTVRACAVFCAFPRFLFSVAVFTFCFL